MKILNSANPSLNPKRTNEGHSEWLRLQWTKCTQKIEGVLFFLAIQSNKIRSNHVQKIRERDRTAMKGGRQDFFFIFHQRRNVESKSTGEKFESQHWGRSALSKKWLPLTDWNKNIQEPQHCGRSALSRKWLPPEWAARIRELELRVQQLAADKYHRHQ